MNKIVFTVMITMLAASGSSVRASEILIGDGAMRQDLGQNTGGEISRTVNRKVSPSGFIIYHQPSSRWTRHYRNSSSPAPR